MLMTSSSHHIRIEITCCEKLKLFPRNLSQCQLFKSSQPKPSAQIPYARRTMSPISITFSTPTVSSCGWIDSFEEFEDEEIEEIILQCRSATAAFEAALSNRRNPSKDIALEGHYDALLENANDINRSGLTEDHEGRLKDVHSFLIDSEGNAQTEHHAAKAARQYLWLVSRVTGWSYALLMLCTFGKNKVQRLSEDHRVNLIKHINEHRHSLFCPRLEDKAIKCSLDQIRMDLPLYIIISTKPSQISEWTLTS